MAREIVMPALEMAQDSGVLVRWLKPEGEFVTRGEPLMEIETAKAVSEIEAPDSGILCGVTARAGDEVPVGRVIALLLSDEEYRVRGNSAGSSHAEPVPAKDRTSDDPHCPPGRPDGSDPARSAAFQTRASPKARRLAAQTGIDLSALVGSGPDGALTARDVSRAQVAHPTPRRDGTSPQYRVVPIRGIRRAIAERLTRCAQEAPHIRLSYSIDMGAVQGLLGESRASGACDSGKALSLTSLISKAVATTLVRHRRMNAHVVDGEIWEFESVHLGVAVSLEDGLLVPVLRDAQSKTAAELQAELRDLADRARRQGLPGDAIRGSTFTVSNLGMYGVDSFTALLNPPEVAILSIGAIRIMPALVNGAVTSRPMMTATINVDHRAVDGAVAGRFMQDLKAALEAPRPLVE